MDGRPRYRLLRQIGAGAFGRVYLAEDRQLSEPGHPAMVAVKVFDRTGHTRRGLADEATQARRISHRSIVRVFDRDVTADGQAYIVYEYIPGGTLTALLDRRNGRIPARTAAEMCASVARGVQAIHSAGLSHGDLKPQNILLDASGAPRIVDFALVRSPTAGDADGTHAATPAFTAPERLADEPAPTSPITDVFSLGAMLFWLITGRAPLGDSLSEVLAGAKSGAPLLPTSVAGVDRTLARICARALAIDPRQRYASAGEFAADLELWIDNFPVAWTRPGALHTARLIIRRHPRGVAAGAVATLALAGLAYAALISAQERERQRIGFLLERERTAAAESRLQTARDTVRAVFGAVRRANPVSVSTAEPPTLEQARDVLARSQGVWTAHIGDIDRIARLATTGEQLSKLRDLMLDTERTFWTVTLEGYLISEPEASVIAAQWRALLRTGDPWLLDIDLLHTAARANRIIAAANAAAATGAGTSGIPLGEARSIAEHLRGYVSSLTTDGPNAQFLLLAYQVLAELHGRNLLANPAEVERYARLASQLSAEYDIWKDRAPRSTP
ncbi:MAG: serine/threonine protein kinase [Phycisphaeraceae bacterium]|nr:serine/threonine protein kinase [Phycisphaeraceae bacterium]